MIKLFGVLFIITGTSCYGFFMSFKKKNRLLRLKQFKEMLLCFCGELRVVRMTVPEVFRQLAQKSRYSYISQFCKFVSESLFNHIYSGFWETWSVGIDLYIRDIYLTEGDTQVLKNAGNMPLYLDNKMQLIMLEETIGEIEKLIEETEKDINQKCRIYQSAGVITGLMIVLILI